jgi:hypothetical protein
MGLKELWSKLVKAEHDHAVDEREALDKPGYDDLQMDTRIEEFTGDTNAARDELADAED